ncbi:MAG TPA: EamA family transporter [Usitatibacter sp.]|nr:EamA family transporter [Usitatibacter sp.]
MTRRGWALFVALGIIWGMPYLLIRIAVESIDPLVIAFGRTLIGALLLLPVAVHRKALAPAFRHWPALAAFTLVEISGPWLLIGHAETRLNSSTTGLLIAMVPLMAAVIAAALGHERLPARRLGGLVLGFAGVASLVGLDVRLSDWAAVAAIALASLGYAVGPIIIDRKLKGAPPLGVITGSLVVATALYAPFAVYLWPAHLMPAALASVAGLGVICTAAAFLVFFALIAEAGPARATVIAYVNPLVAVILGCTIGHEVFSHEMFVAAILIVVAVALIVRGGAHRAKNEKAADETELVSESP